MSLIKALRIPNDPQAHMQEIKLPAVEILAPRGPAMRRSCGTVTALWSLAEAPRRENINLLGTVVARAFGLLSVGEVCTGDVILAGCDPQDHHAVRSLSSFLTQLLLGR